MPNGCIESNQFSELKKTVHIKMGEDWLSEQLAKLQIKETRANTLNEIRTQLLGLHSLEQVVTQRILNASVLYDVLNETEENSEHADIATDILSMCLNQLSVQQQNADSVLRQAMHAPRLRVLALNAIVKELPSAYSDYDKAPHISDEILSLVLEALQNSDTAVGMPAVHVLSFAVLQRLQDQHLKTQLQGLLAHSEVVRLRVYEIAINVSQASEAAVQYAQTLLEAMVHELSSEDVLLQLNVLELLTNLGASPYGYAFLEERGVVSTLSRRVEELERHPLDQLLVPGIMKFFGKIAYQHPEKIIVQYPHLIDCLFDCMRSGDNDLLGTVFDTYANVASSKNGKELLMENYNDQIRDIMQNFTYKLRNLPSELKGRAFVALQHVFTYNEEEREISRAWFNYLSQNSNDLQFLMDFIRNPFPDIKVACLGLVRQLCHYGWGVEAVRNTAGLVEYLLDRKLEFDKEVKYAKYEVIQLLDKNISFDPTIQQQLHLYNNQGPYYVEPAMDIATEGH